MKTIIKCEECGKESFVEGDCPNDIIKDSGYIHDEDNDGIWFCSKKCEKNYKD